MFKQSKSLYSIPSFNSPPQSPLTNKIQYLQQKMFQKQKQSPYRSNPYQSLEHNKQNTVKQIELVFTYYAGKCSKYNYQELPQKYFTEMASQLMQLAGMPLNRKSQRWMSVSTLYYTKGRSKPLYFGQFLELLPGLARCLFGQGSPRKRGEGDDEQSMKNLLVLFQKLYHIILEDEVYRRGVISEEIAEDTKQFLLKLKDSLTRLYKVYFEYELGFKDRQKDYHAKSFEAWLEMMKDFEVFPKIMSASQLFFVFNETVDEEKHNHLSLLTASLYSKMAFPRLGEHFTLTRMAEALILASHIAVSKLKRVEGEQLLFADTGMSQKEALKLLLEYMETMRSVKEKDCKYSKERFCLIVYDEYAEYVGRKQQMVSSNVKTTSNMSPEHKRSFFEILNKIDL